MGQWMFGSLATSGSAEIEGQLLAASRLMHCSITARCRKGALNGKNRPTPDIGYIRAVARLSPFAAAETDVVKM